MDTFTRTSLVKKAKALAYRAHEGQIDKANQPYIEHVARVAAAVADDPEAEAVAWLHDVLEDCPAFADEFWNFPPVVTRSVHYLTRIPGQQSSIYYKRISKHPIALRVKLADIADNSSEDRLSRLDPVVAARLRRKYTKALKVLGSPAGDQS